MQAKLKLCGIRTIESACVAAACEVDFIGLNFTKTSRRRVEVGEARDIIAGVPDPGRLKLVGVFQNQLVSEVNEVARALRLDYVQLHGSETPAYCKRILVPIIKAFPLAPAFDPQVALESMEEYSMVSIYLVDRYQQGVGDALDVEKVKILTQHFPIMLAGGITIGNALKTIEYAQPFAIDMASGIETNGIVDIEKVKEIAKLVKV